MAALQGQTIDLLINNAGILLDETLGELDFDSFRLQMEINAFAPLKISEALLPNMPEGSKIANITSRMGSIADNSSGGRYGYRASKAAFNALGRSLAIDLKGLDIAVAQLHPGFVKTRMVNFSGLITPQESATWLEERIEALNLENSGSFWHRNGEDWLGKLNSVTSLWILFTSTQPSGILTFTNYTRWELNSLAFFQDRGLFLTGAT